MKNHINKEYNTPYQLKLPLEIEKIIEISDPVYTFCEVLSQIDLKRHLVVKENRIGRRRFDSEILLKVILFAFMEHGYVSTREIEKLCKTDIRFMWLLQENEAPSHMTIDNFMNQCLADSIENIFNEINRTIVYQGVRFDIRNEYAIEYLEQVTKQYVKLVELEAVYGRGHHKTTEQKYYDKLVEYTEKLKKYAEHIRISGEHRKTKKL